MFTLILGTSFGVAFGVLLGRVISMRVEPWNRPWEVVADAAWLLYIAFVLAVVVNRVAEWYA